MKVMDFQLLLSLLSVTTLLGSTEALPPLRGLA